jgi:hypothetical protein
MTDIQTEPYTVTYYGTTHHVVSADYHRNGVGGAGFYVALVDSTEGKETDRYLVTTFPEYQEDGEEMAYSEKCSVVRVDQLAAGNIGMFPVTDPTTGEVQGGTGCAAYRGADYWGLPLLPVIKAWIDASRAAQDARFKAV